MTDSFCVVAGHQDSPVILHVPHSATYIPPDARASIVLSDEDLAAEVAQMTDMHTEHLARSAGDGAWLFINQCSRLVVDPERFPDEREKMLRVGMGAVYTATSAKGVLRRDDPVRDEVLVERYFVPYAEALADLVDQRLAETGRAVIIDVHSYPKVALPYELHGDRRPDVCLGADDVHTPAWLVSAARSAFEGLGGVVVNEPFAGAYVPLKHYESDPRVLSLMIELRRDTYMVEPGGELHGGADRVISALTQLVRSVDQAD